MLDCVVIFPKRDHKNKKLIYLFFLNFEADSTKYLYETLEVGIALINLCEKKFKVNDIIIVLLSKFPIFQTAPLKITCRQCAKSRSTIKIACFTHSINVQISKFLLNKLLNFIFETKSSPNILATIFLRQFSLHHHPLLFHIVSQAIFNPVKSALKKDRLYYTYVICLCLSPHKIAEVSNQFV